MPLRVVFSGHVCRQDSSCRPLPGCDPSKIFFFLFFIVAPTITTIVAEYPPKNIQLRFVLNILSLGCISYSGSQPPGYLPLRVQWPKPSEFTALANISDTSISSLRFLEREQRRKVIIPFVINGLQLTCLYIGAYCISCNHAFSLCDSFSKDLGGRIKSSFLIR